MGEVHEERIAGLVSGYRGWLERQPLSENTKRAYRVRAGQYLVRGGNDLVLVAEIAVHKRLETTRRYSLPSQPTGRRRWRASALSIEDSGEEVPGPCRATST